MNVIDAFTNYLNGVWYTDTDLKMGDSVDIPTT